MSQIGNNVYPNTSFPDSKQTLPTFTDLTVADQSNYINYLKEMLAGNRESAKSYLNAITNTAIINASKLNTLKDTIDAIQDMFGSVETFTNIINQKQAEWQKIINNFKYIGDWEEPSVYNSSITYNIGDLVLYSNKIWRCKIDGITSAYPPTNSTYWEQYYLKNSIVSYPQHSLNSFLWIATRDVNEIVPPNTGSQWQQLTKKGDVGENGQGFNFYNGWDSSVSYSVNNLVAYNGKAYRSIQNNNYNHEPPDGMWWQEEFVITTSYIPMQSEEPTNQVEGEIWFQIIN